MPYLNERKGGISNVNNRSKDLEPIKSQILKLNTTIVNILSQIKTLNAQQELDNELRQKMADFISYSDKKRVNAVVKDITLIKKQINLSKTSKILKTITSLKERVDNIEDSLVSDEED